MLNRCKAKELIQEVSTPFFDFNYVTVKKEAHEYDRLSISWYLQGK